MSTITLELPEMAPDDVMELAAMTEADVAEEVSASLAQIEELSPEEQCRIEKLMQDVDLHNNGTIMRYGSLLQHKLDVSANEVLGRVIRCDTNKIRYLLMEICTQIKEFDTALEKRLSDIFRSARSRTKILQERYVNTSEKLEQIGLELLGQQTILLVNIEMFDKLSQQNLEYYKELTRYIQAGGRKLKETQAELEELRQKAEATKKYEDVFQYDELASKCTAFQEQLDSLTLTKTTCAQLALQIRLMQEDSRQLAVKIRESINNTIPIWKQNVALAVRQDNGATETICPPTSYNLQNSAVKTNVSEMADIEAVRMNNARFLGEIGGVLATHDKGYQKRKVTEAELQTLGNGSGDT